MTEALVETIQGVFKAGKAADNGFKKEAWLEASNAVIRVYQGPIRVGISASQYKNKQGDLMEKQKHWLVLSKQSGFGQEEDKERDIADKYIQERLNKS